ncbi:MAG: hypothetical protein WBB01_19610 [Phormidesmis sp.]
MGVARQMRRWLSRATRLLFILGGGGLLSLLAGCAIHSQPVRVISLPDVPQLDEVRRLSGSISEVAPPAIFGDLAELIGSADLEAQPQVAIAAPKPDQTLKSTALEVKIDLKGLSIYKDESTGLGPHLQLILDNRPARSLYDLNDPIELSDLAPGSHSLRVLAVKPWGESFKNESAYARTTFHVYANTGENVPDPEQPLLTYSAPQGAYGAEPILLDFYLENAPLHLIAQEDSADSIPDWRLRCDVNGQRFFFDQWQPVYLKGFKPGQNWVQLTLVDEQDNPIDNVFNSTVRLINYDADQRDSLAKMVRGELPLAQVGQIVDPAYQPPVELPEELAPEEPAAEESAEPAQAPEEIEVFEAPPAEIIPTDDQGLDDTEALQTEAEAADPREDLYAPEPADDFTDDIDQRADDTAVETDKAERTLDFSAEGVDGEERLDNSSQGEVELLEPELEATDTIDIDGADVMPAADIPAEDLEVSFEAGS